MRIKLDENLGRPHVALLKRHGYDADRVFDQVCRALSMPTFGYT